MTSGRPGVSVELDPDVKDPLPAAARTVALVDLDVLSENFRALRSALGEGRDLMAVVKAEGYGHGGPEAARAFGAAGARWFGVATVEEGEALRPAEEGSLEGVRILILSGAVPEAAPRVAAAGLEAAVWSMAQVEALAAAGRAAGRPVGVHVKVDSGMGRLGLAPGEAADFLRRVASLEGVEAAGLMSHLARADEEEGEADTRAQFEVVRGVAGALREEGLLPPLVHCANSAGGILYGDAPGDLVRAGIALYGCPPGGAGRISLRQAMTWKSAVIQVKGLPAGTAVGYGGTYRRKMPGRIAVVAAGYGDGYPRLLSNRADALVGGRRAPVVGRVSMDMLTLDVTGQEGVREGDEVVLLGAQGEGRIPAGELAARAETIPYEIFCGVGARVPRLYLRSGRVVSGRCLGAAAPRGFPLAGGSA